VGVAPDEQRPVEALVAAVVDDRLRRREDVRLVERGAQARSPVPRGAEGDLLVDVGSGYGTSAATSTRCSSAFMVVTRCERASTRSYPQGYRRLGLVVLGAGTAGTMVANKLRKRLPATEWSITVVDKDDIHDYQPGYLFIPFGINTPEQIRKTKHPYLDDGVELVMAEVDVVEPRGQVVHLVNGRSCLRLPRHRHRHDPAPRPDPRDARREWHREVGSSTPSRVPSRCVTRSSAFDRRPARHAHHRAADQVPGGPAGVRLPRRRLPQASKGLREATEIVYVTPLDGAFTKPVASRELGNAALEQRNITVETDFMIESVDQERQGHPVLRRARGRPTTCSSPSRSTWAPTSSRSGLGDELNYVPVDKHTCSPRQYDDIFALGDASNLPTSKAGSVAHFSVDVFVENFLQPPPASPMTHSFDGHANCFVESGNGKALLLDFNYDTEPLTGTFPLPKVGPMSLLKESRANHLGKLAFRHVYWNALLPGRPLAAASRDVRCRQEPRVPNSLTPLPPRSTHREGDHRHAHHHHRRPRDRRQRRGLPHRPDQWRRGAGPELAALIGIDLTDKHWVPSASCARTSPPWARPRRCAGSHPGRHPGQGAVRPLPRQARQEDGLRRRAAQAQGLRLSHE
jgi:sulfide:quinone oxidoreductase